MSKDIYLRHEISIGDYLMSHQKALRDEFMQGFNTLEEAVNARCSPTMVRQYRSNIGLSDEKVKALDNLMQSRASESDEFKPDLDLKSWKNIGFRYERHTEDVDINYTMAADSNYAKYYPTAYKLITEFGDKCPIAQYSAFSPNMILNRHTGPENRTGKYIRIHIPLIIPEGDVFLEVNGEEITWTDLFAFNNQKPHSAYNLTSEYRLIFLIDIEREHIGLPQGKEYDPADEFDVKPFVRKPKL